ncbi:hypothetical protein F511_37887 [Dorcoceras hygrometricum]|uniref:Uncharacterized protein n=1 Tax=Dorcoceras hygrometricum TaxID=472368 RepID=A0A2Z7CYP2_9LAMI|nr:hypothetical protein F511_37887 [Dorcoceras hygrometricum]
MHDATSSQLPPCFGPRRLDHHPGPVGPPRLNMVQAIGHKAPTKHKTNGAIVRDPWRMRPCVNLGLTKVSSHLAYNHGPPLDPFEPSLSPSNRS